MHVRTGAGPIDRGGVRQHLGRELRVPRARSRSVTRIDPADGSVLATIPVGGVPLEVASAARIDLGLELRRRVGLQAIDPGTNAVVATIRVCHAPEGLAGTAGSVWIVCEDDDTVRRIDPATERDDGNRGCRALSRFALAAFGNLWVSNFVEGSVSRIDPVAGKVIATIDVESGPQLMLAASGGVCGVEHRRAGRATDRSADQHRSARRWRTPGRRPMGWSNSTAPVWVASDSGPQLHRIDPTSGTVDGPWPVADQGTISANQLLVGVDGCSGSRCSTRTRSCNSEPPDAAV